MAQFWKLGRVWVSDQGLELERGDAATVRWKRRRWPEIKKSPKKKSCQRLHRRERAEWAGAPVPDMGAV
jgi:hypothetical protein